MQRLNAVFGAARQHWPKLLLAVLSLATVWVNAANLRSEFTYPHGFASSDLSTTARTFLREGVLAMNATPVNNNPPVNLTFDAYTHWPPLLPVALSQLFRIFGESEAAGHALMLGATLASALMILLVGCRIAPDPVGELAACFWLMLPVVVMRGFVLTQQTFVLPLLLFAVYCWLRDQDNRYWAVAGAAAVLVGCLSAWEIALLAGAVWLIRPGGRRISVLYTASAAVGVLVVAVLFISAAPERSTDALQVLKFRMGFSVPYTTLLIANSAERSISAVEIIIRQIVNHFMMLGFGVVAAGLCILHRKRLIVQDRDRRIVFAGLALPWLVWCVVLSQHAAIHDFELLIAAPFVSIAMALLFVRYAAVRPVLAVFVLVASTFPLASRAVMGNPHVDRDSQLVGFGKRIREVTSDRSIVLSPCNDMLPTWVSERHIIRGVHSEKQLRGVLGAVASAFPGVPIYVATHPETCEDDFVVPADALRTVGTAIYQVR